VSKAPPATARAEPTYLETWKATAWSVGDSARRNIQGTLLFGGAVLLLLIRLSNRLGTYVVDDEGRVPGRVIDVTMLGLSVCILLSACGAPWPLPRTLVMIAAASFTVFAANRLWRNIETQRNKLIYGLPLGAGAIVCALAIGSIITSRLYGLVDSLRDY
jgi:hypothetical protein